MDLYKIMLVDDEEEVRTSIIKKINWEANGTYGKSQTEISIY